jgi:hypothetical protein
MRPSSATAAGIFFLLVGGVFLLGELGVWRLSPALLLPLLLIGVGLSVLLSRPGSDAS